MPRGPAKKQPEDTSHQSLESKLWAAADKLRGHLDAADYILANPPFNISDWGGDLLRDDKRWQYGIPPTGNANFAWVQHMVHHLAPYGIAGFVLANGSMSSNTV
ncbi:N-6 DNA methylase [Acidithiobacillus sp. M4-SHS-6]|uniref:HsdM family class I SAM-dependent methyltransferase n=1 Tax=Acidithiobacillus sp. M4-SHS-6 TaxID=3383024 RepID=UPI0039BE25E6